MSIVSLTAIILSISSVYFFQKYLYSYLTLSLTCYLIFNFLAPVFSIGFAGKFDKLDEIFTINLLIILLWRRIVGDKQFPVYFYLILLSLIFGLISGIFSEVNPLHALQEMLLFLKGWTAGAIFASLSLDVKDCRDTTLRISAYVSIVTLVGSLLQYVIKDWVYFFNVNSGSELDSRWGSVALVSIYNHPGVLAQVSGIAACTILALRRRDDSKLYILLATSDIIMCMLTFRRRSIIALAIVLLVLLIVKTRINRYVILSLVIPISAVLVFEKISFLLAASRELTSAYLDLGLQQARTALYLIAPIIANDYFPFGSGLGTFGTYISSKNYSPIYSHYGLSGIWGLRPQDTFITDTFWPAIIGELGWIGFALFFAALISIFLFQLKSFRRSRSYMKDFYLCSALISFYLLIDSIAAPTFLAAPVAPIFGIFAGLSHAIRSGDIQDDKL